MIATSLMVAIIVTSRGGERQVRARLQILHLLSTKLANSICDPAHVKVSCDGVDRL
jgi:hypothetical protein